MPTVSEKLAHSLNQLKKLQDQGIVAIQSKMLERSDRERLLRHGFIQEVMRGWYILSNPGDLKGDSTAWYTSYWDFCAAYLTERLGDQWCLSPEQSLKLHIGDRTIPKQLLVRATKGRNKPTELIYGTSIMDIRQSLPDEKLLTTSDGIRLYTLEAAIVHSAPNSYTRQPMALRTALAMVGDASGILTVLIDGGHSTIAGRLAGAYRNIGRSTIADNIIKSMVAADYNIRETDPFEKKSPLRFGRRELSPHVNRIKLIWSTMREQVIEHFPQPPNVLIKAVEYLEDVDDRFISDAYHSLSIEGYRVTEELIELVRSGRWDPENSDNSKQHLDAMAAKGYWEAFQLVKKAINQIFEGSNAGETLESVHGDWYLALFLPSVTAGIVNQSDLAGYRSGPVYIRQSMHTPPSKEAVRDMMPAFFDLLAEEDSPAVRVVLGHFMFVYIHPYFDGNGRMGRFIMNMMLASGGYPWTVVPVNRRADYMSALEAASVEGDIVPFTKFIASLMQH